jgi:hypothetical protein
MNRNAHPGICVARARTISRAVDRTRHYSERLRVHLVQLYMIGKFLEHDPIDGANCADRVAEFRDSPSTRG